jgi:hypothetical protein
MDESGVSREFRYLDTEAERQDLVADIRRVRQSVIQMAENVPPERHYEPRYHGWSLAALLAHLNTIDNFALFAIKLSLLGIHPPLSPNALDQFNDLTAKLFHQRLVSTTIRQMRTNEKRICDFIMTLPMGRFTHEVYHPPSRSYLTVERALQQYFLFHWQEHLQTMQRVEGIYYEPPGASTEM